MAQVFDPRRAEPGQRFVHYDYDGERIEAKADDQGVIHPKNEAQVRLADAFGLPLAREHKAATDRGKEQS